MIGRVMACEADDACIGLVWPGEDWLIFDTAIGSFELVLCDEHYSAYQSGEWSPTAGLSAVGVLRELILNHPVVHG